MGTIGDLNHSCVSIKGPGGILSPVLVLRDQVGFNPPVLVLRDQEG